MQQVRNSDGVDECREMEDEQGVRKLCSSG